MQRCAFTPYEGKKPYIFISYAHKDSHLVFPILEELDRRGYRIWYDDGIAPGSEWPENIAQHLDGCSVTMAFISPNSIASANCRREVTFALSKRKAFLGIVLQPTEMSLGMEMQLSAQQCIMKYTYADDEAFYGKVCSCPDLQPCLGQPKAAPVETPAAPPAPVAPTPAPAPKPRKEKKPVNKKLIGIVAGAAAAVALLAIVLGIALGGRGDEDPDHSGSQTSGDDPAVSTPADQTEPSDFGEEFYLYYSDQVITAKDVAYINQQTMLDSLEMHDCVIQDGAFAELQLPDTLTSICLENCTGISDLRSLAAAESLTSLKIVNCGITDADLPKLTSRALYEADVSGNPNFTDLGIFADCTGLESICFANTGVASLEALADKEKLYTVSGSYTQVKDLTAVTRLTELREVYFAGCGITTIETPFYSLYLETVDLSYNGLQSLDALIYCAALVHVDLAFNDLYDVDVLAKSASTLETLDVSANFHLYDFDLEFLNSCVQLRRLTMDGLYLGELNFISELEGLEYLSAVGCDVRDISTLQKLTCLNYLNLAANRITDIAVLAQIANEYMTLDISLNEGLEDVSALPVMYYRYLNLTGSVDPYTVPPVYGDILIVAYHEAWTDANCMNEADRDIFNQIALVDCPLDKIVALEKRFGKDRITFIQEEDAYIALLKQWEIHTAYIEAALSA